jgi:GMP synthase-like glutamine amidotransferase
VPAIIVNHVSYDDPGVVRHYLDDRNISWSMSYREDFEKNGLALDENCELLVLLGSLWDPFDSSHAGVRAELSLIERAHSLSVPTLGVCYGAELLALVSGAKLFPLQTPSVGYSKVDFTSPLFPSTSHFFWNYLGFSKPTSADGIAMGPESCWAYYQDSVLAVQFHLDATPHLLTRWTNEGQDKLEALGLNRAAIIQSAQQKRDSVFESCELLLDRLLGQVPA